MNFRRGAFRLWVAVSMVYVALVVFFSFGGIREQFVSAANYATYAGISDLLLPVIGENRLGIRGTPNKDFTCDGAWLPDNPFNKFDTCWYKVSTFRSLYPELRAMPDAILVN